MNHQDNDIEQRLRYLEDKIAIMDIISRYGLAADLSDIPMMLDLWHEDGVMAASEHGNHIGHQGVTGVMTSDYQALLIASGSAHSTSIPNIQIEGNQAIATAFSILCRARDKSFVIERLAAVRWEFEYRGDCWKIIKRSSEPIFGSNRAAKELLSRWHEK